MLVLSLLFSILQPYAKQYWLVNKATAFMGVLGSLIINSKVIMYPKISRLVIRLILQHGVEYVNRIIVSTLCFLNYLQQKLRIIDLF